MHAGAKRAGEKVPLRRNRSSAAQHARQPESPQPAAPAVVFRLRATLGGTGERSCVAGAGFLCSTVGLMRDVQPLEKQETQRDEELKCQSYCVQWKQC